MKKKKIILGSSSKFRRSLFSTLNIDFTCISPDIDESRLENEKPKDMAIRLSIKKAMKICKTETNALVIGQMLVLHATIGFLANQFLKT